jgi:DNA invertase Pin-like site-specific DNA recombinase
MKRAGLYIRVSTEEQARHGFSLGEQRHALEEYAARNGFSIVDIYADEGATARKALKNRHELQRLLADVRAGLIDCILFIKLDRWFRNVKDYYAVQDILDKHNVQWIATQEEYNTTTSNGRLMLNLKLSIAQNESDQTGDRIRFVFEGKKRRCEVIGGGITYGYKIENHKYIIDEPRAAIVRAIFLYFSMYQSIAKTQQYINDTHSEKLLASRIRHILGNERYIGRFFGVDGYAPAIIDLDLWERVQKILAIGRRAETPRAPKEVYLFSGLLFCPSCSGRMNGLNPRRVKYYRCRTAGVNHLCDFKKCIREAFVETYLLDNIEGQANQYAEQLEVKAQEIEDNTSKIQSAAARLNRLKDLYVNGFIDRQTYEKDFKTYNTELTQAKRANRKKPLNLQGLLSRGIAAIYKDLSLEGKKTFWRSIIHRLELTSDLNINIVFL